MLRDLQDHTCCYLTTTSSPHPITTTMTVFSFILEPLHLTFAWTSLCLARPLPLTCAQPTLQSIFKIHCKATLIEPVLLPCMSVSLPMWPCLHVCLSSTASACIHLSAAFYVTCFNSYGIRSISTTIGPQKLY